MADWRDELWKACKETLKTGGEVRIVFMKRNTQSRLPVISIYKENYIKCNEETVIIDD